MAKAVGLNVLSKRSKYVRIERRKISGGMDLEPIALRFVCFAGRGNNHYRGLPLMLALVGGASSSSAAPHQQDANRLSPGWNWVLLAPVSFDKRENCPIKIDVASLTRLCGFGAHLSSLCAGSRRAGCSASTLVAYGSPHLGRTGGLFLQCRPERDARTTAPPQQIYLDIRPNFRMSSSNRRCSRKTFSALIRKHERGEISETICKGGRGVGVGDLVPGGQLSAVDASRKTHQRPSYGVSESFYCRDSVSSVPANPNRNRLANFVLPFDK
jgi:hypothetical protein